MFLRNMLARQLEYISGAVTGVVLDARVPVALRRSQPEVAQWFAIPRHYRDEGVLRYGFHGLCCEYIARRLAYPDAAAAEGRSVVAHLGH